MFQTLRNAFKNPDLRKRLIFTILVGVVFFRFGSALVIPGVDTSVLSSSMDSLLANGNTLFTMLNLFSGNAFGNATLFALSISPYITASIIIQLLTVALPPLERLAKEGETGRKKLNKITKYTAVAMALIQGFGYYTIIRYQLDALIPQAESGWQQYFWAVVMILTLTAGAMIVTWMGDQITEKGVGNGISVILFVGILAGMPSNIQIIWEKLVTGIKELNADLFFVPFIILVFAGMIVFIVILTDAERRIPIQYAKRVVGRKMYGGQNSYLPIKVNMSSVLPIIFANSLLMIIPTILSFTNPETGSFWWNVNNVLSPNGWVYCVLYFFLIIGFNYFYVAIQYNPVELANNIKNNNGAIPGIRPGKPTATFIQKVISKIVFIGAMFLAVIAIFPIIFNNITQVPVALGGTSIIIVVGVALETTKQLESQLMMRHHKGFLE